MLPFVTIIVPVRNEAACIENTLRRLAEQNYEPERFEIIVADGRSTDDTVLIVRRLQFELGNIKLHYNPKRISSAARNLGVRQGRGEYFVIIDGHCEISDRNYLQKMIAAFERSGAACLGRPQPLEIGNATVIQEAIALARRSWLGHNPSSHIFSGQEQFVSASSVAVAYRREVFEKLGRFDEQFDACEDVEFNTRVDKAGLRCYFTPEIAVHYHPRSSIPGLIYQMSRYGRGRIRLARKHPHSLTLPALAPIVFGIWCVVAIMLGFWLPLFAKLFCLSLLAYIGTVAITSLSLLRRKSNPISIGLTPLVYLAVHVGFAWGTLSECLSRILRKA
ncbi:MAG TPA: glycosyltransferase family 2 protein [Gemmataceae bacterium]|jgi:succinoglycan biosynthesis protein ExoA|nr:glycosyltransferase family 2 protein [Gemmataceae bacterium]